MKHVSWDINVIENEQKRHFECIICGIFGKYKCNDCNK